MELCHLEKLTSKAEADVANSAAIVRGREKILNIARKLGPPDKAAFIDFLYSNSNLNQNLGRVHESYIWISTNLRSA